MVVRGGHEAGDDQLPHTEAGEGRPLLREDLRPDEGLRVLLRQVQARPLQGHRLRQVRRRGGALARCAASAWATSSWRRRWPHLVRQGHAEPPRPAAGHLAAHRWSACCTSRSSSSLGGRARRRSARSKHLQEEMEREPSAARKQYADRIGEIEARDAAATPSVEADRERKLDAAAEEAAEEKIDALEPRPWRYARLSRADRQAARPQGLPAGRRRPGRRARRP